MSTGLAHELVICEAPSSNLLAEAQRFVSFECIQHSLVLRADLLK